MHCNSEYPAAHKDLNLSYLKRLTSIFPDHLIGYSGHERGGTASIVAAALGAKVIERHITLDRAMWGTDQAASIEWTILKKLIRELKNVPIWIGEHKKIITEAEEQVKKKLRDKETLFD